MKSGEKIYVIKTGEKNWITTAIRDGDCLCLYFGDEAFVGKAGFLYSFSMRDATPELNWECDTQSNIASTPAIVGENLLLINDAKRLFIVDKNSGTLKESMNIKGEAWTSGIVYKNGKFYFSCKDAHVYEAILER
jgi:outer membrane protein assembly factor BamB